MSRFEQPEYLGLLVPDALAKMGRLELIARQVVEGFISGKHASPYKGFSVEFAEHREYTPGDDIRNIDWRVYAKSDRYYVKQYEEETNVRAYILLDCSGSMKYAGGGPDDKAALSKFDYARLLAASLTYLMLRQQDAVGLVTFDTGIRRYIPPRSRANHLQAILQQLVDTAPAEETSLGRVLHDLADRIRRRGLVIVISDGIDDAGELLAGLHHFRHARHEVLFFQVLAWDEVNFPFTNWSQFRDLEIDGRRVTLDPIGLRRAYLARVENHIEQLRAGCGRMKIDYIQADTAQPFDGMLAQYLARRSALTH